MLRQRRASQVSYEEREERLEKRLTLQQERAGNRRARESAEQTEERLSRRRATIDIIVKGLETHQIFTGGPCTIRITVRARRTMGGKYEHR